MSLWLLRGSCISTQVFKKKALGASLLPRTLYNCFSVSALRNNLNYDDQTVSMASSIKKWEKIVQKVLNKPMKESAPILQNTPIKTKVDANFEVMSKTRFKVDVTLDPKIAKVFEQMKTKEFDSNTSTWSFELLEYFQLLNLMAKHCSHVKVIHIPLSVVKHLSAKIKDGTQRRRRRRIHLDWSKIDSELVSTLMPFQREGIEFCVGLDGRAMIADDMGLGKTLQAIAVMKYYCEDWPLLVVCPSSVKFLWAEAFKHWVPSLDQTEVNVVMAAKDSISNCLVNIISYDMAVKMASTLRVKKFKAIIVDESHFVKNWKTARYKALSVIVKYAKRFILLSGTPALSRPFELYTQICMLSTDKWNFAAFGKRYCGGYKVNELIL